MNNQIPKAPEIKQDYQSKYIMSIICGGISVVLAALGFIHWTFYIFSLGFALTSVLFAFKYFTLEKVSIVAAAVSVSACMIFGYSIIRTGIEAITGFFDSKTKVEYQYYDPLQDYYDNFFDDFRDDSNDNHSSDYWD